MPYATVPDVESLNRARKLGVGNNQPTSEDVEGYLGMVAGEIDAILINKGYAVPVQEASTTAWALLRGINAKGALVLLEKASPVAPNVDRTEKEYEIQLDKLRSADFSLDAPTVTERSRPRGPGLTVPRPGTLESEPFFSRKMRF